jgi:Na+-driven multidrug efflux pump
LVNLLMTAVLVAGITLIDKQLLGLFLGADSPAIPIARHIGHIVGWTFLLMGVSMVLISVMRANGAVLVPLLMLINSTVVFRLGFGLGFYPTYGAEAIWWSSVVSACVSILQTAAYFKWGKWRDIKPRSAGSVAMGSGIVAMAEAGEAGFGGTPVIPADAVFETFHEQIDQDQAASLGP